MVLFLGVFAAQLNQLSLPFPSHCVSQTGGLTTCYSVDPECICSALTEVLEPRLLETMQSSSREQQQTSRSSPYLRISALNTARRVSLSRLPTLNTSCVTHTGQWSCRIFVIHHYRGPDQHGQVSPVDALLLLTGLVRQDRQADCSEAALKDWRCAYFPAVDS